MHRLLGLILLSTCVANIQDLSGKMFTFPLETNTAHVRLNTAKQDFGAVTVCHRSFTDLRRDHILFSLATPTFANDFLVFWDATNKEMEPHIRNKKVEFRGQDYKPNMWHSVCTTWDSQSGLVQLWFDGQPSEQDSYGSGFDQRQSFVGMMSDVHMWDYTLSLCEIQNYVDRRNFTPGNVLNWSALDFQIIDKVLVENKVTVCY